MTAREQLAQFAAGSKALPRLCREYKKERATVHLKELVGGALSFYAAAAAAKTGGVHVFVAEDRDAAAYLMNDFYNLLDEKQVYFFPSSYKRSVAYGAEDAQGVVQRTAAMNAVKGFTKGYLIVCTYPEALAERVADAETLRRDTIAVKVGDSISIAVLEDALVDANFTRVDFVYEPGQYSVRGGIVDVFSFSESKPYRIDFFGDEVDSIRRFNISSQLSADKLDRVEIIPNLNAGDGAAKVSFVQFAGDAAAYWFYDADYVLRRVNDIRRKTLADMERPEEIDRLMKEQNARLEQISGMSSEDAKNILIENMKAEAKSDAAAYINETIEEAKLTATKEAKRIIVTSIQRVATETAIENAVTVFNIESDEVKGRIIGREGRNIRALEAATGIEIIVDDTPEAIILSGFDPVRREIARLALHQLVTDGRIHPARIEEVVAKVQKQIEEEIVEVGKRTAIDLGIHGLHPELIRLIGKMKYRSSYGQNLLQHARETANLAGIMASELGLNPKIARRAGLLHDIGKVPDDEPELPHAIIGMKLAEKYKEKPDVCNAIGAHHDEVEMTSIVAPIIQVCDAISGARPGARREVVESYIKRLKEMEEIALSYPGVQKTYAIQAGRELRVIVGADKLSDQESEGLSRDIAKKIQDEMTYPGQVKITVIRETRAVAYAK